MFECPGIGDRGVLKHTELLTSIPLPAYVYFPHRKAHTQSAKKWLEMLEDKSVPVLVCLTYADKLYAEHMGKDGSHPEVSHIQQRVAEECSVRQ